eukprot:Lankesteria_metandrocarpae@DN5449_c0_g1_i2.p1
MEDRSPTSTFTASGEDVPEGTQTNQQRTSAPKANSNERIKLLEVQLALMQQALGNEQVRNKERNEDPLEEEDMAEQNCIFPYIPGENIQPRRRSVPSIQPPSAGISQPPHLPPSAYLGPGQMLPPSALHEAIMAKRRDNLVIATGTREAQDYSAGPTDTVCMERDTGWLQSLPMVQAQVLKKTRIWQEPAYEGDTRERTIEPGEGKIKGGQVQQNAGDTQRSWHLLNADLARYPPRHVPLYTWREGYYQWIKRYMEFLKEYLCHPYEGYVCFSAAMQQRVMRAACNNEKHWKQLKEFIAKRSREGYGTTDMIDMLQYYPKILGITARDITYGTDKVAMDGQEILPFLREQAETFTMIEHSLGKVASEEGHVQAILKKLPRSIHDELRYKFTIDRVPMKWQMILLALETTHYQSWLEAHTVATNEGNIFHEQCGRNINQWEQHQAAEQREARSSNTPAQLQWMAAKAAEKATFRNGSSSPTRYAGTHEQVERNTWQASPRGRPPPRYGGNYQGMREATGAQQPARFSRDPNWYQGNAVSNSPVSGQYRQAQGTTPYGGAPYQGTQAVRPSQGTRSRPAAWRAPRRPTILAASRVQDRNEIECFYCLGKRHMAANCPRKSRQDDQWRGRGQRGMRPPRTTYVQQVGTQQVAPINEPVESMYSNIMEAVDTWRDESSPTHKISLIKAVTARRRMSLTEALQEEEATPDDKAAEPTEYIQTEEATDSTDEEESDEGKEDL